MNENLDTYLGHTTEYWLELNKRAEELIQEIVRLKGQIAFIKDRFSQITEIIK